MDPNFKPYRTGMLTVKEKYPCGCGDGHKGRNHVFYLCRCDCGKEVIFSGDEIAKHPYSCGCTPKPTGSQPDNPPNLIGHGRQDGTLLCMIRPTRAVYSSSSTGVSGVSYEKRRKKWRVQIGFKGKLHFLGYYSTKEEAIKARLEGEKNIGSPYSKSRSQPKIIMIKRSQMRRQRNEIRIQSHPHGIRCRCRSEAE